MLVSGNAGVVNVRAPDRQGNAVHHLGVDRLFIRRNIHAVGHGLHGDGHDFRRGRTQQLGLEHILHQLVHKHLVSQNGIEGILIVGGHQRIDKTTLRCGLHHRQQGIEFVAQIGHLPIGLNFGNTV